MMHQRLPDGLAPMGCSPTFTMETVPAALQSRHALGAGRWGVLQLLTGSVTYVDLDEDVRHTISAPDLVVIGPEAPHKLELVGPLTLRVDFFREGDHAGDRHVLIEADDEVVASFVRCEITGDIGERFYTLFLNASPEIARHFEQTDFAKQRKLLRGSVYTMVTRDPRDEKARETLQRIGETHGRTKLDVPPRLYDVWLDCLCETVKGMDPEWTAELEQQWRIRMRAGIQVITAAY